MFQVSTNMSTCKCMNTCRNDHLIVYEVDIHTSIFHVKKSSRKLCAEQIKYTKNTLLQNSAMWAFRPQPVNTDVGGSKLEVEQKEGAAERVAEALRGNR